MPRSRELARHDVAGLAAVARAVDDDVEAATRSRGSSLAKWRSKSSSGRGTRAAGCGSSRRRRPGARRGRARPVEARAGPPRPRSPRALAARRKALRRGRARARCQAFQTRPQADRAERRPARRSRPTRRRRHEAPSYHEPALRRPTHAVNFGRAHRMPPIASGRPGPAHLQAGRDEQDRGPPHPRAGKGAGGGQGGARRRGPATSRPSSR